ncbi:SusD/RagB family nutrient-binding outer membrane lipoprotein [Marinilongibacter aquaticus]|uniref:SusD/RagB family nutrient-binding outer membrane lipoprotein n=1 Tax=Marinilongibacter aquaticus TaxID=2975157 RepID=UPI0021BD0962|nr:SusD/RagB family nutrient-binding outer membrane lipoprotein [Marinilongibacter aquaticus]UBM59831.1 SusD/RagB family nutrient-binding outer membrane lipoprotein [Marinilongibacter aquaticus]
MDNKYFSAQKSETCKAKAHALFSGKGKLWKAVAISTLAICSTSCKQYSEGLNVDPNNFTDAPGESIIGQANLAWVMMSEGEASRMAGLFTDQYTGFSNQYINYNQYDVKSSDFDGIWTLNYTGGISQTRIVREKAIEAENTVLLGVAQIAEAEMAGELAALFGNVPYEQSAQPVEFPNPQYDDQMQVFADVQNLLTEALGNVGNAKVADAYGSPVFVENAASWAEVAHSLKARYYLITKEYDKALSEARMGISVKDASLMAYHSELSGQRNLYYQFGIEQRGGYLTATRSYLRRMINNGDVTANRLLFTPGEDQRLASYFQGSELNYQEGGYFAMDAAYPIMDWYENQLIIAECEVRQGNDDNARTAFNAVRNALSVQYGGDFPEVEVGGETLLKIILEEKYITLIGSVQVFHDMRRTDNVLGVPIKNSEFSNVPQRFLYPQVEINTNTSFPGIEGLFIETEVNQ